MHVSPPLAGCLTWIISLYIAGILSAKQIALYSEFIFVRPNAITMQ